MKTMIHKLPRLTAALLLIVFAAFSVCASSLGNVINFKKSADEVTVTSQKGKLIITPYSSDIVKVKVIPAGETVAEKASKSVVLQPGKPRFSASEDDACITVALKGGNSVKIDKATSQVQFISQGKTVLEEKNGITRNGKERRISFKSRDGEAFYGCGERGVGYNLKGDTMVMFNKQNYAYGKGDRTSQMNITVPFYISSFGYGVYFDDYTASKLVLKNPVEYITESRTPVSYYVIFSEKGDIAGVVKNYTALTGRQELAPFWALGYITSKYGYRTQAETEGVIDTLRREGYPVDGIVLDLYWYGKEEDMGRFEWNKTQWPDHKGMLAKLKDDGVKTVIISQPYINKIGAIDNYNMMKAADMLTKDSLGNVHDVTTWVGEAGMLDVSNPKTREWMWNRYKLLTDEGVTGWWGDLGEPEVHPLTICHANGETASEYHNIYGNEWSRIIYDGFKKDYPRTRLMTLMRGGTAGLQRFSVFPWSTDVGRSWAGLQAQVPIMINSALSGFGYMSHDVGGFAVDPENPVNEELYARWLQLGLFTPVFRTHSTVKAEPYHYTAPGYQEAFKKIVKARYEWLPYNYTLAYENAVSGAPFVRPLNFYDTEKNEATADIQDEYLWGRNVLVAPVLDPGKTSREVYFPAGKWYSLENTAKVFNGPATIECEAPLHTIPVFAKAGAFIPMADYEMRSTEKYDPSRYVIRYFSGADKSEYSLFDDDRTSTRTIEENKYQLINFLARENDEFLTISVDTEGYGYLTIPAERVFTFEIVALAKAPAEVSFGKNKMKEVRSKAELADNTYYYDAATATLYAKTAWSYKPRTLSVKK